MLPLFILITALILQKPIHNIPVVVPVVAEQKVVQKTSTVTPIVQKVSPKLPEAHLQILKIGVNAVIKEMGVTSTGNMAVPGNRIDVGWFSLGTTPGHVGSAVIGGHNRYNSGDAVFNHLDQLEKGDIVSVIDKKGITSSFIVRDIRTYDATNTETGIFDSEEGTHLNLITCSGVWDPSIKNYTKRLVVFTDSINLASTSNLVAVAQ